MADSEDLKTFVDNLALRISKIRDTLHSINEEETKYFLINPLLKTLGWDIEDFEQTRLEYPVKLGNDRADFVLMHHGKRILIIEAKPLGTALNPSLVAEVSRYPLNLDLRWCILTDGNEYVLIDGQANVENRVVERISLDKIQEEGYDLLKLITPSNVFSGILEERRLTPKISNYYKDWKTIKKFQGDPSQYIRKRLADDKLCIETDQSMLSTIRDILLKLDGEKLNIQVTAEPEIPSSNGLTAPESNGENEDDTQFLNGIPETMLELYRELDEFCLNLKPVSIKRHVTVKYISYLCKDWHGFCDVRWQKKFLKIWLRIKYNDSYPDYIRDVSKIGHWGNGDVEIAISSKEQLESIKKLILESYNVIMN